MSPRLAKGANPNWHGGPVMLFCQECDGMFLVIPSRALKARFCSLACANKHQARTPDNQGERIVRSTRPCRKCGAAMLLRPRDRQVFCSDDCHHKWRVERLTSGGNVYSRSKRGRRPDLGTPFFRSGWEANYARYLNLLIARKVILSWEYEAETFWFEKIRRGVRSYTPDFKIRETIAKTYFVEVKGWMDPKSATKLKRMKKYYPHIEVRVVGRAQYREIESKLGKAIPGWEAGDETPALSLALDA